MRAQLIAFAALCLAPSGAALADPTGAQAGKFHLPARAKDVCQAGCIGYSPSTDTWVCGIEASSSGPMSVGGTHCSLQLLRGTARLAELTVYSASDSGMELADESLPIDRVSPLLPGDLASTTTLALPASAAIQIPGGKHSIRVDTDDARSNKKAKRGELAGVTILCNTKPKEGAGTEGLALGGSRLKPRPSKAVVIRRWPGYECGLHIEYQLQLSSEPSQVVLLERADWGCVDFGVVRSSAFPVDLASVCQAPPAEKTR